MWLFGNWSSNTYKYYYCFGISLHFPMFSVISRALVPEETAGKGGIHTTEQQKKRLDQCSGSQRLFVIGKRNVPPLQQLTDPNDAGSICTALHCTCGTREQVSTALTQQVPLIPLYSNSCRPLIFPKSAWFHPQTSFLQPVRYLEVPTSLVPGITCTPAPWSLTSLFLSLTTWLATARK